LASSLLPTGSRERESGFLPWPPGGVEDAPAPLGAPLVFASSGGARFGRGRSSEGELASPARLGWAA
jgi:hypothetical protein